MAYTSSEIDEMEQAGELYVCPHCDHHGHADDFGDHCPQCGASLEDEK